jgi:triphosphoribosyl-dephospho-CoA synthase
LPLSDSIVHAHVRQLAKTPDSLIARKCGVEIARESADRAAAVLASGAPGDAAYQSALATFDAWLRADGHRRNPGTTADLIAAGLFVLLREGRVNWTTVRWD